MDHRAYIGSRCEFKFRTSILALFTFYQHCPLINYNLTNIQQHQLRVMTKHLDTPKKARFRGAADFLEKQGQRVNKSQLVSRYQVSRDQVTYALQSPNDRVNHRSQRKRRNAEKPTVRDLDRVELVIQNNGFEGYALNWAGLLDQFGFNVTPHTLRTRMQKRDSSPLLPAINHRSIQKPVIRWLSGVKRC